MACVGSLLFLYSWSKHSSWAWKHYWTSEFGMIMDFISWNQAECWRRKSSISTANTPPQLDFVRPEQWGRKKCEAWFHELKECIKFISKLSSYLGFWWLTSSPLNIDPQNNSMENMIQFHFSVLGGFCKIFKNRRHALISFNPLLVSHFMFEPH